tara:strand:- start:723 stop:1043 length:321 start_codon:yes stop_codon:yes gene_type:complete
MNYYRDYNNPQHAQADDIDIVMGVMALARSLRDDVKRTAATVPIFEGVAQTIINASFMMSNSVARRNVWEFGEHLLKNAREKWEDIDDMICDYLSDALSIVEEGES